MTCIRLLEILPVVFERVRSSFHKVSGQLDMVLESGFDVKWLHDLMDWGKSSLPVIVRYWKQTIVSLLGLLKGSCNDHSTSVIRAIEKLISCGKFLVYYFVSFFYIIILFYQYHHYGWALECRECSDG